MSTFRAAFVCTGNRFRSPLAEAVFRQESERLGADVAVESYGLLDLEGAGVLDEAREFALALGIDLGAHRSRPLRRGALAGADLVVGFERVHVATAVVDAGAQRDVAFTLPEVARLLGAASHAGPRDRVVAAAARREARDVPELEDPLGRPPRRQEELAARVVELTRLLARGLFAG